MRGLCLFSVLLAATAWADEPADRAAIRAIVESLKTPPPAELFTPNADAEIVKQLGNLGPSARPRVNISHEPWGEATIDLGGSRVIDWRVECRSVRFVSRNVAVVQIARLIEYDNKLPQVARVNGYDTPFPETNLYVVVMLREHSVWKIDYAREYVARR